ncbi:hypothetical protein ACIQSQ_000695 [Enterococcus hirae]
MKDELLKQILAEQQKTNVLLKIIINNSDLMIPAEVNIAKKIADKMIMESTDLDVSVY